MEEEECLLLLIVQVYILAITFAVACLASHVNNLLQLLNRLLGHFDWFFNVHLSIAWLVIDKDIVISQLVAYLNRRGQFIFELE